MSRRITVTIASLSMVLMASTSSFAVDLIPIAPRTAPSYFYTMQLRGLSMNGTSETVEVFIQDGTYDASAYGRLKITDTSSNTVLKDTTYGSYGNYDVPGTFAESFDLPCGTPLLIQMYGQEFSYMSIVLGASEVAGGGSFYSVYPTYTTSGTIDCPTVGVERSTWSGVKHLYH